VPLRPLDFTADIVALLKHPPHGFGSCMNPCIDCHARMLRRAGELMAREGFDFLATGEVLNERPMSQNRRSLDIVARESGFPDLVLRPLSARLLAPTRPEQDGRVDRARLLDLEGRGRRRQMALAVEYGVREYPTPAGGCKLTEPEFSARLAELKAHEGLDDLRALRLLRYGRHFRLGPRVKAVVGRNEADNAAIAAAGEGGWLLEVPDIPGPTAWLPADAGEEAIRAAAGICVRYGDAAAGALVTVTAQRGGEERRLTLPALARDEVDRLRIG
jgi:hypothetical protein